MSNNRSRHYCLVTYLDEEKIKTIISRNNVRNFAYILHNKDTKPDGTPKESHYHIILDLFNAITLDNVRQWFKGYLDENGKEITTLAQRIISKEKVLEYLIHKNQKEKYQYSIDDIKSNNLDEMYKEELNDDNTFEIIEKMLNHVKIRDLVKQYGKNFVYHYDSFRSVCNAIEWQENTFQDVWDYEDYKRLPHIEK